MAFPVTPTLALPSESAPEFRPLSRAAREIMEVCGVDPSGCEDPDLESDTTAHALHVLEHERRLMAKGTDTHCANDYYNKIWLYPCEQ